MRLFKRDGKWHAAYHADGKLVRFSTGISVTETMAAAESAASEEMRKRLVAGGATPSAVRAAGGARNLAEVIERTYVSRWRNTASDVQLKYVVRRMEAEIGHWLLTEVDYKRLKGYRDGLIADGMSPATANRRMSLLKVVMREADREGDVTRMPAFPETLAEDNVRERYLTPAEEARVRVWLQSKRDVEAITGGDEWLYMTALFNFLLDTGCRLSEALTLSTVNANGAHLLNGTTKSGKARVVPLSPRARDAAEFLTVAERRSVDWAAHRWGLVRKACDIRDVNLHILRHTCASRLLAAGVDLYTVSKWLGHASVKVTERYAHLQGDALARAAALLQARTVT
jgi:integrase